LLLSETTGSVKKHLGGSHKERITAGCITSAQNQRSRRESEDRPIDAYVIFSKNHKVTNSRYYETTYYRKNEYT